MYKNFKIVILFAVTTLFASGCAVFNDEPTAQKSLLKIEEIQDQLKVGMDFEDLKALVSTEPELLDNGTAKFNMQNGDLWIRVAVEGETLKQVVFWGTIIKMPDGTTIKKTSKDQIVKKMLNNPICIDISIITEFNGEKRTGQCYYEQFGIGNIIVEASEKGEKQKEVSLVLINNNYLLQKGDIPSGNEFKYLAGYMANLQLLQRLIGKGMKEATPVDNGRRSFAFSSDKEPFVIQTLNKKIVYPAPWEVKGFVEPNKEEKGFSFNIDFKVTWGVPPNSKIQATEFIGTFKQKVKLFGQDIVLSDWKQFEISATGEVIQNKTEFGSFDELLK